MDYALTSNIKQCDDFVYDDVYIALCSGYVCVTWAGAVVQG